MAFMKADFIQTRRDELYVEFGGEEVVGTTYGAGLLRGVILVQADTVAKLDWELRDFKTALDQEQRALEEAERNYYKDLITENELDNARNNYDVVVASYNEAAKKFSHLFEDKIEALTKDYEAARQLYVEQSGLY